MSLFNQTIQLNRDCLPEEALGSHNLELPRFATTLFLAFAAYLALPIVNVPLLGLSVSAPLLFLVAIEVFLRQKGVKLGFHKIWVVFSYVFWFGLLLSLAGNALLDSRYSFTLVDVVALIRFAYWLFAFLIVAILVAQFDVGRNTTFVLGASIIVLGALRVGEALLLGNWGAWTGTRLLTQNSYGWEFSTFTPFALLLCFMLSGWKRWLSMGGILLLLFAVAINGSRSSWIAVSVGVGLCVILYVLAQRQRSLNLLIVVGVVCLSVLLVPLLPSSIVEPIDRRLNTLQTLDDDKSYQLRLLMIQKAQQLFEENPFFGAGLGHFRRTDAPLEVQKLLSYVAVDELNDKSAHNSYAGLLGETGLSGTLPFAFLVALLIIGGLWATIRCARRGELWAIAVFVSFICMSIHLWSLSGLTGTAPWFVYGLVAGVIDRERRMLGDRGFQTISYAKAVGRQVS